jgi:uncharacterized protein (UPF0335 family)
MQPNEEQLKKIVKTISGLEKDVKEMRDAINEIQLAQKSIEQLLTRIEQN